MLQVDVEVEADESAVHKDLEKVTAITDIDPNYFTEVKGRLGVGERFSRQRYIEEAREVLRTRLLIGVQRDDCIRIDQQFDEEERRLNDIKVVIARLRKKLPKYIFFIQLTIRYKDR